jgi:hypothetical protein
VDIDVYKAVEVRALAWLIKWVIVFWVILLGIIVAFRVIHRWKVMVMEKMAELKKKVWKKKPEYKELHE